MPHFVIEITYKRPYEEIAPVVPEHRAFLQQGYDQGLLLMSGPMNPRTGGIVIARADALENLQAFFSRDPYAQRGFADYRFIEFEPVKYQPFLASWIQEDGR